MPRWTWPVCAPWRLLIWEGCYETRPSGSAMPHLETVVRVSFSDRAHHPESLLSGDGEDPHGPSQTRGRARLFGWPWSGDTTLEPPMGDFARFLWLRLGASFGAPVPFAGGGPQSNRDLHPVHLFPAGVTTPAPSHHARAHPELVTADHAGLAAAALRREIAPQRSTQTRRCRCGCERRSASCAVQQVFQKSARARRAKTSRRAGRLCAPATGGRSLPPTFFPVRQRHAGELFHRATSLSGAASGGGGEANRWCPLSAAVTWLAPVCRVPFPT